MENEFKFKIEIIRTKNGAYKDNIAIKGTALEVLGGIEKVLALLNDTKQKVISDLMKGKETV